MAIAVIKGFLSTNPCNGEFKVWRWSPFMQESKTSFGTFYFVVIATKINKGKALILLSTLIFLFCCTWSSDVIVIPPADWLIMFDFYSFRSFDEVRNSIIILILIICRSIVHTFHFQCNWLLQRVLMSKQTFFHDDWLCESKFKIWLEKVLKNDK